MQNRLVIRLILCTAFLMMLSFVSGQKLHEDSLRLAEIKLQAKGNIYNQPDSAWVLFEYLEQQANQSFSEGRITERMLISFQGDAYSGYGNYYLVAKGILDSAFFFYDLAIQNYRSANNTNGVGSIYNNKGLIYERIGQSDSALISYDSAIAYYQKTNNEASISRTYANIGQIYVDKGNFPLAKELFYKSLKISEKLKDSSGVAYSFFDIGNIEKNLKNWDVAYDNYSKAHQYCLLLHDDYGVASALFSLANIDKHKGNLDAAFHKYHQALGTYHHQGHYASEAQCHVNLGFIYFETFDSVQQQPELKETSTSAVVQTVVNTGLDSAFFHLNRAVEICLETSNNFNLIYAYNGLSMAYLLEKNYKKALEISFLAEEIVTSGDFFNEFRQLSHNKFRIYKAMGDYKNALKWHEEYIKTRDSIFNEENTKSLMQQEFQYQYGKKAAADSVKQAEALKVKNAEVLAEKAENDKQKIQKLYLFGGLALLAIFGIFMYQRFRVTQQQKSIIELQKAAVEEQKMQIELQHGELEETHKEISDSIKYAERLQLAILPSREDLNENLGNGFVLFQPKDVVSGDFYWMQKVNDNVLFAAADCTGHGVPGAMVSVVCSNALNRSVKEFNFSSPAEILNKTRDLVIETFARSGKDVKDGMDIALCSITGNKLIFSGANNPLWIVRKNNALTDDQRAERGTIANDEYGLIEFKPNKQPVGLYDEMVSFQEQEVELFSGDTIYIFTDGFADQFGGEKGKKLMYKPFKQLIVQIQNLEMEKQKEYLASFFTNWKGQNEQVDDVCIIGVRI